MYGFKPAAVRQQGIDIEHCEVTIRTMAKFHALSFAMKDQLPEEFERIRWVVFRFQSKTAVSRYRMADKPLLTNVKLGIVDFWKCAPTKEY